MSLVGDVIMRARRDIPDPPQTLGTPTLISATPAAGGSLPNGNYFLVATELNPWGESLPSSELGPIVLTGANASINATVAYAPMCPFVRIYIGGGAGVESGFLQFPTNQTTSQLTFNVNGLGQAQQPPLRSTAYLPDSDGAQFGASTLYSWLNEGLVNLSRKVGGIQDYSGVPTTVGQPMYVTPEQWMEISDVWYNGYWVQGSQRNQFFKRNAVLSNLLWGVTVSVMGTQQVLEVTPQPDRTAGVTRTANQMAVTDNSVTINSGGFALLSFGFAQIGTEIVSYSSLANNTMSGMIRGLGSSSAAQAWPLGTLVTELSLFWCGKRIFSPNTYFPGQSLLTLAVPNGWEAILPLYVLSCAAKAQQDYQTAKQLNDQFFQEAEAWLMANKGATRFVQVGGMAGPRPITFDNTVAGGLIVN